MQADWIAIKTNITVYLPAIPKLAHRAMIFPDMSLQYTGVPCLGAVTFHIQTSAGASNTHGLLNAGDSQRT